MIRSQIRAAESAVVTNVAVPLTVTSRRIHIPAVKLLQAYPS